MQRGINGIVAAMQRRKSGNNAITARQEDAEVIFRPKLVHKQDKASLTAQLRSACHEKVLLNGEEDSGELQMKTSVASDTTDESQLVTGSEELEPSIQQEGQLVTSPAAVLARKIWALPNKKEYFSLPVKGGKVSKPRKKTLRTVKARNKSSMFLALSENQDWPRYIPNRVQENNSNDRPTIEESERQSSDEDETERSEYVSWLLFGDEERPTLERTAKRFSDENEPIEYAAFSGYDKFSEEAIAGNGYCKLRPGGPRIERNLTTSDDNNKHVDQSHGETTEEQSNVVKGHEDSVLDESAVNTERQRDEMMMARCEALNVNPHQVETAAAYFAEVLFNGGILPAGPNHLVITFDDQSVFEASYHDAPNTNPRTRTTTQAGVKRKRESDDDNDKANKRIKFVNK